MSTTIPRVSYVEAQRLRRHMVERMDIPAWMVTCTPNEDIPELKRRFEQLRLVPDVDRRSELITAMFDEGHSPDEVANVSTLATRTLVEPSSLTPWGGGAA